MTMPPVDSKDEIHARLGRASAELRHLGIHRIGLFGSFARGQQTPDSDVDLLIEFSPGAKSFDRLLAVADLAESLLGRPVEIVTTEGLSPYLGPSILSEVEYASLAA